MDITMDKLYEVAHEKTIPVTMVMELLTVCNERCKHCYIPVHNSKGLDIMVIKDVLHQFRELGGFNISFTGGEIFLRKDLYEIIEEARKLFLRVFLLTNATLISDEVARKLKELNIAGISVSVYSMKEAEHDWITGVNGSLRRTLDGIDNAKKYGIPVVVKTPLMEKNKYAYYEVSKFCEENAFEFMTSPIIFSQSDGNREPYKFKINEKDIETVVKETGKYDKPNFSRKFEEACGALRYTLAIDSFGDIYPCNAFYYKLGNVRNDSLLDIWNGRKLRDIQNIKRSDLETCKECELRSDCNRCPGLAYLEDGDMAGCSTTAKNLAAIIHKQNRKEA